MNNSISPGESEKQNNLDNLPAGYLGLSPAPARPPARGKRTWVDRPEQLLQAVATLKQFPVIAVDAEFTQIRSYTHDDTSTSSQRMALLQLAVEEQCFIVDALRLHDLSPLVTVMENPEISILLHGAGSDLRVMAERGLNVAHYYDLEATSRSIFGQNESSLASMLHRAFNVHLDKSLQRTDWTRRPLPPAMIAYAARDAEMTFALYHWLHEHYSDALKLHETTDFIKLAAPWIEPFLRGNPLTPAESAVADAKAKGIIRDNEQMLDV